MSVEIVARTENVTEPDQVTVMRRLKGYYIIPPDDLEKWLSQFSHFDSLDAAQKVTLTGCVPPVAIVLVCAQGLLRASVEVVPL